MSISSEIARISGNITDSLTAVASKGITVPSGSNSDDLPDLIAQIPNNYSVTLSLTGASSSTTGTKVVSGGSYFTEITPTTSGHKISSITVTMGGLDITSQVFKPGVGAKAITANGTYTASNDALSGYSSVVVSVPGGGGGGSVTITDEPNATGTTCVITTSGEPTPTPSDIPLNTELIDYTKAVADKAIDDDGQEIAQQWYYLSDYTEIASGMTFSYTAGIWTYIGFYDSSKNVLSTIYVYNDGTVDPSDSNIAHGTLSGTKLPSAVTYVRLVSTGAISSRMSLIRTA